MFLFLKIKMTLGHPNQVQNTLFGLKLSEGFSNTQRYNGIKTVDSFRGFFCILLFLT